MRIGATGLSDALKCVLAREGIRTVAQLAARTRQQIRYLPDIGPARLAEIDRLLAARGLCYAPLSLRAQQQVRRRCRELRAAAAGESCFRMM
jgi:hypothetical protein